MTSATTQISITLTASQARNTYQALSHATALYRQEMLAIFTKHNAEWKYQLPDNASFRMTQLEDCERWSIETMGILSANAAIAGFPVEP